MRQVFLSLGHKLSLLLVLAVTLGKTFEMCWANPFWLPAEPTGNDR